MRSPEQYMTEVMRIGIIDDGEEVYAAARQSCALMVLERLVSI